MSKADYFCLDIETYRTLNAARLNAIAQEQVERKPAHNTLKELKVLWDTEEAREARIAEATSKTALDPLWATVLCVGYTLKKRCDKHSPGPRLISQWTDQSAPVLPSPQLEVRCLEALKVFWEQHVGPETVLVGHNLIAFDLPVLLNAFRRHALPPPETFPVYFNGRWRGRIFDTMLRAPSKTGYVSLDELCSAYGVVLETVDFEGEPMDGSRVAACVEAGAINVLTQYCLADVAAVEKLYLVMTCGGLKTGWDRSDVVAEQVREIESSDKPEAQQALLLVRVLDNAGLIPR